MITSLVLAVVALLAVVLLWHAARGESGAVNSLGEVEDRTRPVDLAAFRNLVDPSEEEYLRSNLAPSEFRQVQRERIRAALEYVERTAGNAAVLIRLGEAARRSSDAQVAATGQDLVNSALRLRLYALLAEGRLYLRLLVPGARLPAGQFVDSYQRLTETVAHLSRLQNPAQAARVSAALGN